MLRRSQSDFMACLLLRLLLKMAKRSLPLPTPRTEPRIQVDSTWTESWVDGTVATWCDICQDLSRYGMYGVWVDGMSRCTDMNRYDRYVIILNDILIIIDTLLFFNDLSTLCGSSGNHRPYRRTPIMLHSLKFDEGMLFGAYPAAKKRTMRHPEHVCSTLQHSVAQPPSQPFWRVKTHNETAFLLHN